MYGSSESLAPDVVEEIERDPRLARLRVKGVRRDTNEYQTAFLAVAAQFLLRTLDEDDDK